ncbi:LysR family transcriptional regulator [Bordetella sp. BOR01]|uniref:LysR family transcriptional regulator n=1 Tax=Bordetella sp. BOR01 TaxID=2854779 RepID=UPI001C4405CB|nr:LysR family transcriptional regulator [Bordetella sp. BOR01]
MKKRLFDTRTLIYFYLVATRGSYRLAARDLAISLSALSRPIQQLERDLGVLLLVRGGRHETQLTPAGQSFLGDVGRILGELQEIRLWSCEISKSHRSID